VFHPAQHRDRRRDAHPLFGQEPVERVDARHDRAVERDDQVPRPKPRALGGAPGLDRVDAESRERPLDPFLVADDA